MLSREDNDLLTLTGPETPAGALFRRYWIPACLSEEVPEAGGPPVRVPLMGEALVAFRDTSGRVGLIGEHCPHRGASLYYGRNEDCGLRCLYHGWLTNADGEVLETPAEPDPDAIRRDVRHTAYPTHEVAGIVFAYLGPEDKKPLFPVAPRTRSRSSRLTGSPRSRRPTLMSPNPSRNAITSRGWKGNAIRRTSPSCTARSPAPWPSAPSSPAVSRNMPTSAPISGSA
jgi:nitrite reductase/ring-hydroxylating ferredoxin subunit